MIASTNDNDYMHLKCTKTIHFSDSTDRHTQFFLALFIFTIRMESSVEKVQASIEQSIGKNHSDHKDIFLKISGKNHKYIEKREEKESKWNKKDSGLDTQWSL